MKELTKITDSMYHIISEPGDGTRYDYFIHQYGDCFNIMSCASTFRYPQRLDYYYVRGMDEDQLIELAKDEACNPWTLRECIRTIMELVENEGDD